MPSAIPKAGFSKPNYPALRAIFHLPSKFARIAFGDLGGQTKKAAKKAALVVGFCGGTGIRTPDPLHAMQVL